MPAGKPVRWTNDRGQINESALRNVKEQLHRAQAVGVAGQPFMQTAAGLVVAPQAAAAAGAAFVGCNLSLLYPTSLAVPNDTDTAIVFSAAGSQNYDISGFFQAGSPTQLLIPATGSYAITASVQWPFFSPAVSGPASCYLELFLTSTSGLGGVFPGSEDIRQWISTVPSPSYGNLPTNCLSTTYAMTAGSTVTMFIHQNCGATVTLGKISSSSYGAANITLTKIG